MLGLQVNSKVSHHLDRFLIFDQTIVGALQIFQDYSYNIYIILLYLNYFIILKLFYFT